MIEPIADWGDILYVECGIAVRGRIGFDRTDEVSVACPGSKAAWLNTLDKVYVPTLAWLWLPR